MYNSYVEIALCIFPMNIESTLHTKILCNDNINSILEEIVSLIGSNSNRK
jgi:hypothetical protein